MERRFGYDRKKCAAMLREAFEPFVLCIPKTPEDNLLETPLVLSPGNHFADA